MNLIGLFSFFAMPCMCIRHDESGPVMYSAPVAMWRSILSSPMRFDTSGSSTENIPPKPQHSSLRSGITDGDAVNELEEVDNLVELRHLSF